MNSAGSATKENEKVLDSITGKIQNFRSEFENLSRQLISSNLVKFVVDLGSGFLSLANTGLGQFIIKVGLATTSVILFKVALNKLKKTEFSGEIAKLTKKIVSLGTAAGTSTFSVKVLTANLTKMAAVNLASLATNPLGWVIAGTVAVYGLVKAVDYLTDTTRKYNEANEAYNESVDKTEETTKNIEKLEKKIEELKSKGKDRTTVEEATLTKYKEQLKTLKEQLKKLEKQTEERKKQLELAASQEAKEKSAYSRKSQIGDIKKTEDSTSPSGMLSYPKKEQPQKTLSYTGKNNIVTDYSEDIKNLKEINSLLKEGNVSSKDKKKLLEEQSSIISSLKQHSKDLLESSKLEGLADSEKLKYKSEYLRIQNEINNAQSQAKEFSDFGKTVLSDSELLKSVKTTGELSEQYKTLGERISDFGKDHEFTAEEVQKLRDKYEDFDNLMKDSESTNEDAAESLTEYANSAEYAQSQVKGISDIVSSVVDATGKYADKLDILTEAVDEFNSDGYITAETLKDLTDNNLLEYLNFTGNQLTANTTSLYDNAEATKYKAIQDLQAAFNADALSIAEGNVADASELAKTAVANAKTQMEKAGDIAAAKAGSLFTFAAGLQAISDAGKDKKSVQDNKEKKKQLEELAAIYTKYGQAIANTSVGSSKKRSTKYAGSGGSKSKSSKSSKSEKEWWEKELDNLKDQFEYNDITIEQYIGSLENLLGRVQQGTEAWKKINKELQKQKLQKVEDDYKRGTISLKQYIKQLQNLQLAYKQGTDAWLDLADKIKSGLKELLNKQKDAYNTAHDAAMKIIEDEIDKINEQKDATEEYYDKLIEDKKKANEESEKEIELAKLQEALANAKKERTKKIFREGIGWVYETDKSAIEEAQKNLDDFMSDKELKELENAKDKALSVFEEQLKAWDKYKESWNDVVDDYENQQAKLTLQQTLGADAEAKILQQRLDVLEKFKNEYNSTLAQINTLEKISSTNTGAMNSYYSNAKSFAGGIKNGVIDYSGYARVHGSSANPEYLFNNGQIRNLLSNLTRPGYNKMGLNSGSQINNYNFGDLNLPNVSNASQFVTELKSIVNITKHQ